MRVEKRDASKMKKNLLNNKRRKNTRLRYIDSDKTPLYRIIQQSISYFG